MRGWDGDDRTLVFHSHPHPSVSAGRAVHVSQNIVPTDIGSTQRQERGKPTRTPRAPLLDLHRAAGEADSEHAVQVDPHVVLVWLSTMSVD